MQFDLARGRNLLSAMYLAAYVTWIAVLVLALDAPAREFRLGAGLTYFLLCGFLAVMIVKEFVVPERARVLHDTLLAIEGLVALGVCFTWRDSMAPVLSIVFMADCGMVLGARALVAIGVAFDVLLYYIVERLWGSDGAWRLILAFGGFQIFATLTAWYARRAEVTSEELRATNAYLLATRSLLEESARDGERLRLARELHDVAGHKLTALKLNLTALQREASAGQGVEVAAQLATELLTDIRGVVAQMREADGLDLRRAIGELIAPLPTPRVHLLISDDARVENVAQAETLLRAVQEALTNVVRHSGAANAWIELTRAGNAIRLQVRDDGAVKLPLVEGFGLAGMRERLALLSGRLSISATPAGGLALEVDLPLVPQAS
jgi:signal transduction histidine kinase